MSLDHSTLSQSRAPTEPTNARLQRQLAVARADAYIANKIASILMTAVEFYADEMTYFAIAFLGDPPCGQFIDDFTEDKPGRRAREALLEIEDIADPLPCRENHQEPCFTLTACWLKCRFERRNGDATGTTSDVAGEP